MTLKKVKHVAPVLVLALVLGTAVAIGSLRQYRPCRRIPPLLR